MEKHNNLIPTFTIIMPTYNRAKLLPRAIKSILTQTFKDFEFIIIDDGSTDNTEEVIKLFNDKRIIYKKLSQNKGCNFARNYALDLIKGTYITLVDSDDEILPNALEIYAKLWREVKDERIGNIVTMNINSLTGEKIGYIERDNLVLGYEDIICKQRARGEFRSCWKREAIGNARFEEGAVSLESILWFRLAKNWYFLYKDIPTSVYYVGSDLSLSEINSQIKNASKWPEGIEILLKEHSETLKNHCLRRYLQYLNGAIIFNLLAGNKKQAKKWIFEFFRHDPIKIKILLLFLFLNLDKKTISDILLIRKKIRSSVLGIINLKVTIRYIIKNIFNNCLYYLGLSKVLLLILLKLKTSNFIFMYHRVNENGNGIFPGIPIAIFERQIECLKKYFTFVTLSQFVKLYKKSKKPLAVITFDDGYKNMYLNALPVLKKYGVPATVFLTTASITKGDLIWTDKLKLLAYRISPFLLKQEQYFKNLSNDIKDTELNRLLSNFHIDKISVPDKDKMLTWKDVKFMSNELIEFGAHTVNHPILTKIDTNEAEKEILDSKKEIELIIGNTVNTFCYPNGTSMDFNESIKQILKESGFSCAVTAIEGKVTKDNDYFALRRISLGNRHPGLVMLKIIKEIIRN